MLGYLPSLHNVENHTKERFFKKGFRANLKYSFCSLLIIFIKLLFIKS